jgi:hypothetical protein
MRASPDSRFAPFDALSEESAEANPKGVRKAMAELAELARSASARWRLWSSACPAGNVQFFGMDTDHPLRPGEVAILYPDQVNHSAQTLYIAPRL